MKRVLISLGALLSLCTPSYAQYIPGTIPGCDSFNGVSVCTDGYGRRWIPLPRQRYVRDYYEYAPPCSSSALTILGIPIIGSTTVCQ